MDHRLFFVLLCASSVAVVQGADFKVDCCGRTHNHSCDRGCHHCRCPSGHIPDGSRYNDGGTPGCDDGWSWDDLHCMLDPAVAMASEAVKMTAHQGHDLEYRDLLGAYICLYAQLGVGLALALHKLVLSMIACFRAKLKKGRVVSHREKGRGTIREVSTEAVRRYTVQFETGEIAAYSEQALAQLRLGLGNSWAATHEMMRRAVIKSCHGDWSSIFGRFDTDGSGTMDLNEFRVGVRTVLGIASSELADEEVSKIFRLMDPFEVGEIDVGEFLAFLRDGTVRSKKKPRAMKKQMTMKMVETLKTYQSAVGSISQLNPFDEWVEVGRFRTARSRSVFGSHCRLVQNFVRDVDDRDLKLPPQSHDAESSVVLTTRPGLYRVLAISNVASHTILSSLGTGLLSGAISSQLWILHRKAQLEIDGMTEANVKWIAQWGHSFGSIMGDYNFFPTFLLFGLLLNVVAKWENWLRNGHDIMKNLSSVGLLLGGGLTNPSNSIARAELFKIYRMLNAAHVMNYAGQHPHLNPEPSSLVPLGLLAETEAKAVAASAEPVEALLTIISGQVFKMCNDGHLALPFAKQGFGLIREVQLRMRDHQLMHRQNLPQVWGAVMHFTVDLFLMMVVFGYPFREVQYDPDRAVTSMVETMMSAVSEQIIICVFLIVSAYSLSFDIVRILIDPYAQDGDGFNVDALLAGTERMLFSSMRAQFMRGDGTSSDTVEILATQACPTPAAWQSAPQLAPAFLGRHKL